MKLSDLKRLEEQRYRAELREANKRRRRAMGQKIDPSHDLPGVRSSGMVIGMTPEERTAWFEKMRKESGVK